MRIETLTDGIFAIAMTLIVFDFKVPAVAQANPLKLRHAANRTVSDGRFAETKEPIAGYWLW